MAVLPDVPVQRRLASAVRCHRLSGRNDVARDYRVIGSQRGECGRREHLRPTRLDDERQQRERESSEREHAVTPPVRIEIGPPEREIQAQRQGEQSDRRKNVAPMFALVKVNKVDLAFGRRIGCNKCAQDVLGDHGRH